MPTPTNPLYARLFNEIKANAPAAVDAVIYQELWRVIEDFLNQTNIWVEEIPFEVNPSSKEYQVTPVGKGCIDRLLMVFDPANAAYDKRWTQQGIRFAPPNRILLMYAPSTATTWMAACAKNVDDKDIPPGDTFPAQLPVFEPDATWIIDKYRDAFRYGTLGYLMMQPAKPYSNLKLGSFNWQNYVAERGRARTDVLHANVYGGQRWMYPQGYATTARKGWT
jgi:hypothetical protein